MKTIEYKFPPVDWSLRDRQVIGCKIAQRLPCHFRDKYRIRLWGARLSLTKGSISANVDDDSIVTGRNLYQEANIMLFNSINKSIFPMNDQPEWDHLYKKIICSPTI